MTARVGYSMGIRGKVPLWYPWMTGGLWKHRREISYINVSGVSGVDKVSKVVKHKGCR
jgi:hypothetical protein